MKSKNKVEVYNELKQDYTEEEVAETFIFNAELSGQEQKEAHQEFVRLRMESLSNLSPTEKLRSNLFAFKLKMQRYFLSKEFNQDYTFAQQLKTYIELTNRSHAEIAENLSVHKTRLSRIVNGRERPNTDLMYRLEKHSDGEIPAAYWWRLFAKESENSIRTDDAKREEESGKVKNPLQLSA